MLCLIWVVSYSSEYYRTTLQNNTSIVAHVGGNFAELLKYPVKQQHSSWLGSDKNADKWYNEIITAYKKISSSKISVILMENIRKI